jgi:hypothetical protein
VTSAAPGISEDDPRGVDTDWAPEWLYRCGNGHLYRESNQFAASVCICPVAVSWGMQNKHLLYAALALTTVLQGDSQGDGSIHYARQAAAMLGPTLWKRVLVIHNSSADGRYPRTLGAVVFEMGGILWFYTSTDGTQSLSLRRDRASEDEQDLGPLLTHIDSGFSHWEYDSEAAGRDERGAAPPNACFIQSIALLRHSLSMGVGAEHLKLLSYYVTYPTGMRGHTVLFLQSDRESTIIDPLMQRRPLPIRGANSGDPTSVANCIRHDVTLARWVPIAPNDFAEDRAEGGRFSNN